MTAFHQVKSQPYIITCSRAVELFREAGISAEICQNAKKGFGVKVKSTGTFIGPDRPGYVQLAVVHTLIDIIEPDTAPTSSRSLQYYTTA